MYIFLQRDRKNEYKLTEKGESISRYLLLWRMIKLTSKENNPKQVGNQFKSENEKERDAVLKQRWKETKKKFKRKW